MEGIAEVEELKKTMVVEHPLLVGLKGMVDGLNDSLDSLGHLSKEP